MFRWYRKPAADGQMQIVGLLTLILGKVDWIMATLQDDKTAVDTLIAKVEQLLTAYQNLLAQVAANINDPATLQAIVDEATAEAAKIDSALNPAPAPTPSGS